MPAESGTSLREVNHYAGAENSRRTLRGRIGAPATECPATVRRFFHNFGANLWDRLPACQKASVVDRLEALSLPTFSPSGLSRRKTD